MRRWVLAGDEWKSNDGYTVAQWTDLYYSNPENPRCRLWYVADLNSGYLSKKRRTDRRERFSVPRKWSTAQAAMKAIDKEIPLQTNALGHRILPTK